MSTRNSVVAAGISAAGALSRSIHPQTPMAPPSEVAPVSAPAVAPVTERPHTWLVRTGGWYIRVDGADVPIPSFDELTTLPRRVPEPVHDVLGTLSPFDDLIARHARAEGFDWRMVAALIYEESHFDPDRQSDKGAQGLMQVRPIAAEDVGATAFSAPDRKS